MSQQVSFESELKNLLKTGKVIYGSRKAIKLLKTGKVKMVIVASTLKSTLKQDIIYYSKISGIPVYEYSGSGWDLGKLAGKPFLISTIAVLDIGNSKIMDVGKPIS
ncbi:50S ribosomal protein L30e [Acidianus sulfidivorans JP7]|uniref:Large ribosomal subunit protein eL30 n=1 Tax=Acidianus sulfidivorans JP7 TaxID=619593 RepID=A0A2U9IME4_9CREN|nr:50S ribosomal protein L30e [Acidianus sulfidivorans]AWR97196.1 50S ribosomal protein L30e [Acidianus sulfidivorans JP7]